ncbi:MAG: antirestriction protein ArdA [Dehalobacterium sp.]
MSPASIPEIKVGITNASYYDSGVLVYNWIQLPTEEKILRKQLADFEIEKDDCLVLDIQAPFKCTFEKNLDLFELNKKLNQLGPISQDILKAISEYDELSLTKIIDIALNKKYIIYEDVINEEELGRKLFLEHQLPFNIPQYLEKYIDFKAVGHDACLKKSIHFIPKLRIAETIL